MISKLKSELSNYSMFTLVKKSYTRMFKMIDLFVIRLLRILPIKNFYIILESQGDYTDNIRTFYDYLLSVQATKKYKIIWIVHNPEQYKYHKNVEFVSRYGGRVHLKFDYYTAVSKFLIFSHPYWLTNWRNKQIVVNTTHSVAQLKAAPVVTKKVKRFDYFLSCSPYCSQIKEQSLHTDLSSALVMGMPRIDLLYQHKECLPMLIDNYKGEKIILSMETFKQTKYWSDSAHKDSYAINVIQSQAELKKLDKILGKNNYKMLVKIHHLQILSFLNRVRLSNIVYLTDDDLARHDIQVNQLVENADILLTDYSSVFYEFLLLDRPIGFLIGDMNEYARGFIMEHPLDEMPGEKIRNYEELLTFIDRSNSTPDEYSKQRSVVCNKVFTYKDNKNCERFFNWIQQQNKGVEE